MEETLKHKTAIQLTVDTWKRDDQCSDQIPCVFLLESKDIMLNHLPLGQLVMQQQTDKIIQVNRTE